MSIQHDWISSMASASAVTGTSTITIGAGTASNSPYVMGPIGTSGLSLSTGTLGSCWNDTISISQDMFPDSLTCKGDASFDGDVKIKGVSIADTLAKIEERLAILRPNEVLEERWEKLKELGREYRELEKEILEKEQIWKILKK